MGPLNFKLPRCMQVEWGKMHKVFKEKKNKRAHLTDKERKREMKRTEKMFKKLYL